VDPSRPWYLALWAMVDTTLRRWSEALERLVRTLRLVRVLLWLGIVLVLVSALLGLLVAAGKLDPKWFYVGHAVATLFLIIPLAALAIIVALPLRAHSVIRLVDMGYPANARELLVRVVARKLHEESIETEELLVDTALNEARKWMRKQEEKRRGGEDPPPSAPPPPPPA
jgi:hypothetical protein